MQKKVREMNNAKEEEKEREFENLQWHAEAKEEV